MLRANGSEAATQLGRAQRHRIKQLGVVQHARGARTTRDEHLAARKERGRMPHARLGEGPRGSRGAPEASYEKPREHSAAEVDASAYF